MLIASKDRESQASTRKGRYDEDDEQDKSSSVKEFTQDYDVTYTATPGSINSKVSKQ